MTQLPRRLWLRTREAAVPRTAPPLPADDPRGWAWSDRDHAGLDDEQTQLLNKVTGRDTQLARVAAEQDHPRLRVWHNPPGAQPWTWTITGPYGQLIDGGVAATHAEGLAVGLAALEAVSVQRPASA